MMKLAEILGKKLRLNLVDLWGYRKSWFSLMNNEFQPVVVSSAVRECADEIDVTVLVFILIKLLWFDAHLLLGCCLLQLHQLLLQVFDLLLSRLQVLLLLLSFHTTLALLVLLLLHQLSKRLRLVLTGNKVWNLQNKY